MLDFAVDESDQRIPQQERCNHQLVQLVGVSVPGCVIEDTGGVSAQLRITSEVRKVSVHPRVVGVIITGTEVCVGA